MTRLITICAILAIVLATAGVGYCGSITGTVTDSNGAAISGISVRVYEFPPQDEDGLATVLTNSSGNYTIPSLPAGQYMVAAFPGLTSAAYINQIYNNTLNYMEATPIAVGASDTVSGINFQLAQSGVITGRVTNASTGNPIASIWVLADNYDNEEAMFSNALTDSDGVYRMTGLPPADYKIGTGGTDSGMNYIRVLYNAVTDEQLADRVTLAGTNTVTGIDFVLSAGGAVSGTITDSNGAPIQGVMVEASGYGVDWWSGETETGADGTYTLFGMASGSYRIHACSSCRDLPYVDKFYNNETSWDKASPVTVTVPGTTAGINFVLGLGTSISGVVIGYDAESESYIPVVGAEVSVENLSTNSWGGRAETEADGSYTVSGIVPGSYRVRANADLYAATYYPDSMDWSGAEPVTATINSPAVGINFELNLGGQIAGTILDQDTGEPVTEGVWINAQPTTGEPWGTGTNQIDSNGSYVIYGLPTGTYKISVQVTGYDQEMYEEETDWMMAEPVSVTVGQTTSGINFTPKKETGGRIIGQVLMPDGTPVANANINANGVEHMKNKWDNTEPNGYFVLTGINVGQWRVRANPPFGEDYTDVSESEEMLITMPEGATEVNIGQVTLPAVNLKGRVMMPDGSTPASRSPVNIETLDWSFFTHVQTDDNGYFRKGGLDAGTYRIRLEVPWGTSGIVRPDPCIVVITDVNAIKNIGVITYSTAAKHIVGQVLREGSLGVSGVQVNCWRRGAEGWANAQTGSDGSFTLDVATGTWEIMIHPSPQQQEQGVDWVYTGYPEVVTFANDSSQETKTVTFTVTSANSMITGRVVGPSGETVRQGAGWIDIKDDSGKGNGMPMGNAGEFSVSVKPGTYKVWIGIDQRTYPYWSSPRLNPVTVTDGNTVNLGDIQLVAKTSGIQGQVSRSIDGAPVSGVSVHAWQREGGWADTTTDDLGNYRLSLLAGTWDVSADPPFTSEYISGQPPRSVVVPDNMVMTGVDFQLQQAGGSIALSLYNGEGALLTDIDSGWAFAREGQFSMRPVAGGSVSNGQCTIRLPVGTYLVGVCLPPNTSYTLPGEQEVTVAGSEVALTLTLLSNNSVIRGAFYTDVEKTHPATGLLGEVFAMQKMGGVWQSTSINSTDGTYELRVAEGEWNLGYWIRSSGYINNPPPDSRVTVTSGGTEEYDFVLMGADATIQGQVLDPNGNPMNHVWIWAHSEGDGSPGSRIDNGSQAREPNGSFTINVPSGREYDVGSNAPGEWGYIQPDIERVTPQTGQTVTVTLRYKDSDASITGTVYYMDGDTQVPCEMAWVNAWSDNGQHAGTGANDEGQFQMNVSSGTTWHLEAFYHPQGESIFYKSSRPVNVVMSGSSGTANIEVEQASREMPPAVSATFDPNVGWNTTLEDGTRIEIPAGAIPADGNVAISFTPMVDELQRTSTDKPVGLGYAISIAEQASGNSITDNFNTNVLITFTYRDEDLAEDDLTEDDISPAYYSTTTSSWTKVESFTVDKDANTVTVQVNHFSLWALTGGPGAATDGEAQAIDMTIAKCAVNAGKIQGQDSFDASGTFAESLADLNGISEIDINIISLTDGNVIYEESIPFSVSQVSRNKFKYTHRLVSGQPGAITAITIDFTRRTFILKSKKIDLTGLACDLQLNMNFDSYILSGDANEAIVNKTRAIPVRLMRTYKDVLQATSAKAKNSTTALADSFTVKGGIAVQDINDVNLAVEEVVITWADQTFTLPAGSFIVKSGKSYKCSKAVADEGGLITAAIDLDKCTFTLTITGVDLDVTSGTVEFGITFSGFDEGISLNLP